MFRWFYKWQNDWNDEDDWDECDVIYIRFLPHTQLTRFAVIWISEVDSKIGEGNVRKSIKGNRVPNCIIPNCIFAKCTQLLTHLLKRLWIDNSVTKWSWGSNRSSTGFPFSVITSLTHQTHIYTFIFSCPEQLNRWPCHSLHYYY